MHHPHKAYQKDTPSSFPVLLLKNEPKGIKSIFLILNLIKLCCFVLLFFFFKKTGTRLDLKLELYGGHLAYSLTSIFSRICLCYNSYVHTAAVCIIFHVYLLQNKIVLVLCLVQINFCSHSHSWRIQAAPRAKLWELVLVIVCVFMHSSVCACVFMYVFYLVALSSFPISNQSNTC